MSRESHPSHIIPDVMSPTHININRTANMDHTPEINKLKHEITKAKNERSRCLGLLHIFAENHSPQDRARLRRELDDKLRATVDPLQKRLDELKELNDGDSCDSSSSSGSGSLSSDDDDDDDDGDDGVQLRTTLIRKKRRADGPPPSVNDFLEVNNSNCSSNSSSFSSDDDDSDYVSSDDEYKPEVGNDDVRSTADLSAIDSHPRECVVCKKTRGGKVHRHIMATICASNVRAASTNMICSAHYAIPMTELMSCGDCGNLYHPECLPNDEEDDDEGLARFWCCPRCKSKGVDNGDMLDYVPEDEEEESNGLLDVRRNGESNDEDMNSEVEKHPPGVAEITIRPSSDDDLDESFITQSNGSGAFGTNDDDLEDNPPEVGRKNNRNKSNSKSNEESDNPIDVDFDEEYTRDETRAMQKIKKSKLTLVIQGFRTKYKDADKPSQRGEGPAQSANSRVEYDPQYFHFNGQDYLKGCCYTVRLDRNTESIVGIVRFLPTVKRVVYVKCVLIVPFEDTILGMEEEGVNYNTDFKPSSYLQVNDSELELPLSDLIAESSEVNAIPSMIYEPQEAGSWQKFGYFNDSSNVIRCGQRNNVRILDIFAGAGGMHLGFERARVETVFTVDQDKMALRTLKANSKVQNVWEGDVNEFLEFIQTPAGKKVLGRIDHVHVSPPCQGFSGANRNGGTNDLMNNELSLVVLKFAEVTKCTTITFENVVGMWKRKHSHYVKNICKRLLRLGYQVRCDVLIAGDYGDPQKRPRFFIFASHKSAPPPLIPTKTHGESNGVLPFVTVKDAIGHLQYSTSLLLNNESKETSVRPGEHGVIRLDPNGLAPAIRASSVPPFHFDEDRCISVRGEFDLTATWMQ